MTLQFLQRSTPLYLSTFKFGAQLPNHWLAPLQHNSLLKLPFYLVIIDAIHRSPSVLHFARCLHSFRWKKIITPSQAGAHSIQCTAHCTLALLSCYHWFNAVSTMLLCFFNPTHCVHCVALEVLLCLCSLNPIRCLLQKLVTMNVSQFGLDSTVTWTVLGSGGQLESSTQCRWAQALVIGRAGFLKVEPPLWNYECKSLYYL